MSPLQIRLPERRGLLTVVVTGVYGRGMADSVATFPRPVALPMSGVADRSSLEALAVAASAIAS